ncbi:MAG: ATP-binding protein, partial [Armatimonadetes bacterium]|nr:ATP-binding protein [Armatimonadota bacterium]
DSLLEWKRNLNTGDRREQAEFIKDMLALVNAHATGKRYLLIGVCNDGTVVGVSGMIDDAHLQQIVSQRVEPPIEFSTSYVALDGLLVGVLEVERSCKRFHMVLREFRDNHEILLRKGEMWIKTGSSKNPPTAWDFQRLIEDAIEVRTPQPAIRVCFENETDEITVAADWSVPKPRSPRIGVLSSESRPPGTVELPFIVRNDGDTGAEDVTVFIQLSQGCTVWDPPGGLRAIAQKDMPSSIWLDDEDNSIQISVDRLTHDLRTRVLPGAVTFAKPGATYMMEWSSHAANMRSSTSGVLRVHVSA